MVVLPFLQKVAPRALCHPNPSQVQEQRSVNREQATAAGVGSRPRVGTEVVVVMVVITGEVVEGLAVLYMLNIRDVAGGAVDGVAVGMGVGINVGLVAVKNVCVSSSTSPLGLSCLPPGSWSKETGGESQHTKGPFKWTQ